MKDCFCVYLCKTRISFGQTLVALSSMWYKYQSFKDELSLSILEVWRQDVDIRLVMSY